MSGTNKEFVNSIFGDYRFKTKSLPMIKSELDRVNSQIKVKSSLVSDDISSGVKKDIYDRYNDIIERKVRLEDTIRYYEGYIQRVDDVMELLNTDYPIECIALRLKHIDCRTITQIERRLNFSRGQCFNILRRGEDEFTKLIKIVS
ncbi:hypothetical protein GMB70_13725 [Turicibacter sanguinis]|nr:hypothetical protein [Turicibacter sanguinis]